MGQYKRMVSYLYKYINGAKSQNIGFVRIELMDKQCRFTVQMRMVPFEVFPKVYLYIQKDYGAKCIEVSDMGTKSGNLVSRFVLDRTNIEQTGYTFEDLDGLIVYIGKEMFFATSWVKDEVNLGDMEIISGKTQQMTRDIFGNIKSEKEKNNDNDNDMFFGSSGDAGKKFKEAEKEIDEKSNNRAENNALFDEETLSNSDDGKIDEGEVASVAETVSENVQDDLNTEKMVIKASVYDESDKDFGERILSTFPIMYPFVSGIIEKSVRIELKDIGCLPIKMWVLANNAFLLHGYCSYRHIIFAKINICDNCGTQYAIGSPGVYNEYDEKVAKQHGFIYFQPIGDVKDMRGAFGYWLSPLK